MKAVEEKISRFIYGLPMAWLLAACSALMLLFGATFAASGPAVESGAVAGWLPPQIASVPVAKMVAALFILAAIGMMLLINRAFDILRTQSRLFVGLFLVGLTAIPGVLGPSLASLMLLLTALLCMTLMYTTYQRLSATRRVFLVFAYLSAGSLIDYAFAAFLPIMLLGCGQMRCLSLRSLLAAGFGIAVPYWIVWGFGIVEAGAFRGPHPAWLSGATLSAFTPSQLIGIFALLATVLFTTLNNLIRVFGFNARTRAFNGIFSTLSLWTALVTMIDFGHAMTYLPMLGALTAMQTTLFFHIHARRRAYLLVVALLVLLAACFTLNIYGL